MRITFTILRHILYLVYLCPCFDLVLFMSYLHEQFLIFDLIFIVMNHIISLKQAHLFAAYFLEYLVLVFNGNMKEENE